MRPQRTETSSGPAANLLFALVSRRYERGSIIVTSNRGFEQHFSTAQAGAHFDCA
jgi:DNA replication protein DnaC